MRLYLRRASLVIGALLIVVAARAVETVCRTTLATASRATDPSPDFVRVGIEGERICETDLRMPTVFAVAGVAAIAGAVVYRPKR